MHGKGIYKWPDGGEYLGEYINNIKEGFGKFKWPNGKEFEGYFHDGKPHGNGFMYVNTEKFEVEFSDGKLIKNVKVKISTNNLPQIYKSITEKKTKSNTPKSAASGNANNNKIISPSESKNDSIKSSK